MSKPVKQKQLEVLVKRLAEVIEGSDPNIVFHVCTAILAANDVVHGNPFFTVDRGQQQVHGNVHYFSTVVREYTLTHNRLPSISDLLHIYAGEVTGTLREYKLKQLN